MTQSTDAYALGASLSASAANEALNSAIAATPQARWAAPPPAPEPKQASPSGFVMVGDNMAPLFMALAKAQGAFPPIGKADSANVTNKDGKFLYKFTYADLAAVIAATAPALAANGLCCFDAVSGPRNKQSLRTILAHESGAYIQSMVEIQPKDDAVQSIGSDVTYMRRYCRMALLGVFPSDEDDDGAASEGRGFERTRPQTRATPPTPSPRPAQQAQRPAEPKPAPAAQAAPQAKPEPKPEPKETTKGEMLKAVAEASDQTRAYSREEIAKAVADAGADKVREDAARAEFARINAPSNPPPPESMDDLGVADVEEPAERTVELDPAVKAARRNELLLRMGSMIRASGMTKRADAIAYVAGLVGHPVAGPNDLTFEEATIVVAALEAKVRGQ